MATIDIRPRAGAGPVRFGMSREDVHGAIGPPQRQYKKFQSKMLTDCYYDNELQIFYGDDGRVEYVEINGPGQLAALLQGVDLLSVAAEEAIEHVGRMAEFDPSGLEIPYQYVFPGLDLALWRPVVDEPEGRTFRSLGVGRSGYFRVS
jgi:hypothetical protein